MNRLGSLSRFEKQPDLRRSVAEKRATFKAVFQRCAQDYPFRTLLGAVHALP